MTNEQKALLIQREINEDKSQQKCEVTTAGEAYAGAMLMAKWKDEQRK